MQAFLYLLSSICAAKSLVLLLKCLPIMRYIWNFLNKEQNYLLFECMHSHVYLHYMYTYENQTRNFNFFIFILSSSSHSSKTVQCVWILCMPIDRSANGDHSHCTCFWALCEVRLENSDLNTCTDSEMLLILIRTLLWLPVHWLCRHGTYSQATPGLQNVYTTLHAIWVC